MTFFDEDFLRLLPDDPLEAGSAIAKRFLEWDDRLTREGNHTKQYAEYLTAIGLFKAFAESYNLNFPPPSLGEDVRTNIQTIREFFRGVMGKLSRELSEQSVESAKAKYLPWFGRVFLYEFSEGDLKRVQELINELRKLITDSSVFEEDHRRRLLKRLEKLQSELHKKVTDLDRFWGLVGDAGVALGKFGNDAKPIVDRIRELVEIIWRTQARAEELPSAAPFPQLTEGKSE